MTAWERPKDDDLSELKLQVDLVALCQKLGVHLEQDGDRWSGPCPVHDDTDPSFSVYSTDKGFDRAGCWSCQFNEDCYGVAQKIGNLSFGKAIALVRDCIAEGLTRESRPSVDSEPPPELRPMYEAGGYETARLLLADVWSDKGLDTTDCEWIVTSFALQGNGEALLIPFFDAEQNLPGLKRRFPDTKPLSVRGSKLRALYGTWRDRGQPWVVLCEGESDTWRTAALLKGEDDVLVLGLPSGVSARPQAEWLEQLNGRDIVLLFDADDAGRSGARNWAGELEGRCRIAVLPDGDDACSASDTLLREAIDTARPAMIADRPFDVQPDGYYKLGSKGGPAQVSSFTLTVRSKIELEDDIVYEVTLDDEIHTHQMPASVLASSRSLKAWANPRERVWLGTDADAQQLLREMQVQSCYVPRIRGTAVAGLHENTFVLPDGVIGQKSWAYVPPVADVRLAKHLTLNEADWDAAVLPTLAKLHKPEVTTPILGWIAAAPLRSMFRCFPVLAVTGGSGFGKTTLVASMLNSFGFGVNCVLTATTPHAVQSFGAATNAFPVWYDEYRAGARSDTKMALDQLIRDAWDGKASVKGGLTENRSALSFLEALAPIVVTGEDAFTETSHAERMIIVPIKAEGRHAKALTSLRDMNAEGLGYAYLEWLRDQDVAGVLPAAPDVPDRMKQAMAAVGWGYELLLRFGRDHGIRMPNWAGELVSEQQKAAGRTGGPYVVMLRELFKVAGRDGFPLVDQDGDDLVVRIGPAVQWVKRETEIVLPGNAQAAATWLTDVFGGVDEPFPFGGRQLRLPNAASRVL